MKLSKEVFNGSVILLVGVNLFSLAGFIFQISMARLLSIADYGILAALFSILYILGIFTESLQTISTQFASSEDDYGKIKNMLRRMLKRVTQWSFMGFILYLILAIPLSLLLKIPYLLVSFTGFFIFAALLVPVTRGVMQGKKLFFSLSLSYLIEGVLKLSLGVGFVYLGLKIYGAVGGTMLATFVAFAISFISLRKILKSKESEADVSEIIRYSVPTFIVTLIIIVFYSSDIVFAKIFFSPENAGTYAIASVIAKAIFWGTQPISKAMFPLSSERRNSKNERRKIFANSFGILSAVIIFALIIFYAFSNQIIFLFSGRTIIEAAKILPIIGIAMGFMALSNLFLMYKLSLKKITGWQRPVIVGVSSAIIQIILLYCFGKTLFLFSTMFALFSIIFAFILVMSALLFWR